MQDYNFKKIYSSHSCIQDYHTYIFILRDINNPQILIKVDRLFKTSDLKASAIVEFIKFFDNNIGGYNSAMFKLQYDGLGKYLHTYNKENNTFNACDVSITDQFNVNISNI